MMRQLNRVRITDHVIRKDDISLTCKANTERWPGVEWLTLEPPIRPMSMRIKDPRMLRSSVPRPVEVAPQIKPRQRLDQDFLDCVILLLNLPEDLCVKRRLLRH